MSVSNSNDVSREAFRIASCHLAVAVHVGLENLIRSECDQPKRGLKYNPHIKHIQRTTSIHVPWPKGDHYIP